MKCPKGTERCCKTAAVHDTCHILSNVDLGEGGLLVSNLYIDTPPVDILEEQRMRGPGGAPTRATTLPNDPVKRKDFPIASGVLDYFPDALVAISEISKAGNDQHNPGLPLRWTRSKSGDEADTCMRHFLQRGTRDTDGKRHTAKAAWRILALLQKEIESEQDSNDRK